MKRVFILSASLFICFCAVSQERKSENIKDADYYMQKSRNQKSSAWVCLGFGAAMIAGGNLMGNSKTSSFDDAAMGAGIGVVGVISALYSLRLFAASSNNKKRAIHAVSLKMQPLEGLPVAGGRGGSYPSIQIRFRVGAGSR
jgi:hypothetical protein